MRALLATSVALILACGGGRDTKQSEGREAKLDERVGVQHSGSAGSESQAEGSGDTLRPSPRRVGEGFAIRHGADQIAPALVEFTGPELSRRYELLYDPASVLSVVTSGVAVELGLEVASELGQLELLLGGETREVDVAVLDAARFGDQVIDGLAVAICNDCVELHYNGRLGANALRHFETVNEKPGQMTLWLDPGARQKAATLDIQPFVRLRWVRGAAAPAGAWIEVTNLAPRALEQVVVRVGEFSSEPLERVAPGERMRVQVIGAEPQQGSPVLANGRWGELAERTVRPSARPGH